MSSNAVDIHALSGAYALDAVNDLERAAFNRHMNECASCMLEVDEMKEAAARLSDSTVSLPPLRLRESVLSEIRRTPQERSVRARREPGGVAAATRWRRWTAAAVAAGIIAAGAGTATWMVDQQRVRQERARLEAERAQTRLVADVLAAPDARIRQLAMDRGGRGTLVLSASRNEGVVMLNDLPQTAGTIYELWTITGNRATKRGSLAPGQTTATSVFPLDGAEQFGLSIEPAGGSEQPTQVVSKAPLG
jgi:anti-sigma-K factor RskA